MNQTTQELEQVALTAQSQTELAQKLNEIVYLILNVIKWKNALFVEIWYNTYNLNNYCRKSWEIDGKNIRLGNNI